MMRFPRSAEAGAVLEREAEVGAAVVLDGLHLRRRADRLHQQMRVLGLEDRHVERLQVAVDAQDGRVSDGEVEIGGAEVAGGFEQLVHEFGFDHGKVFRSNGLTVERSHGRFGINSRRPW